MSDFCNFYDYELYLINPCNQEIILFNLKAKDCFSTFTNPQGKIVERINLMVNGHGKAIDSDNEYVYNLTLNQIININPNECYEITAAVNNNVIGKGKAPSFVVTDRVHITITPNGDTTVSRSIFEIRCRDTV